MDSRERRAARREREAQLIAIQQRIVREWMNIEAQAWVSTVGFDKRTNAVTVTLNRRDPSFVKQLIEEFGSDNITVEPDPATVVPLSPA